MWAFHFLTLNFLPMTELLLSSQRLEEQKVLSTGKLDLSEAMEQLKESGIFELDGKFPENVILEWKEVQTPATPTSFSDLAGKKLTEYKFQYLGQFIVDETIVAADKELFIANFPDQNISNTSFDSTGWLNCTWLLDLVMNAATISQDSLRIERLICNEAKEGFTIALSRQSTDKRHAEQEKFVFDAKFASVNWEHTVLFSGQEVC